MSGAVPALEAEGVGVAFGGVRALEGVSLAVRDGEIFALIGPNGAGKTTLFNVVSGLQAPDSGRVRLHGRDVTGEAPHRLAALGLSRTFQNLQLFGRMTALENVMVGGHRRQAGGTWRDLFARRAVARVDREAAARSRALLAELGLAGLEDRPAAALPYGAAKRLEIARALAGEPRVLLLDEPAAGCNAAETAEIEALVADVARRRGIATVLVEHDMRLVMRVSDRVHVLDRGRTLAEGTPAAVRREPAVIEAYLGRHGAAEAARALAP